MAEMLLAAPQDAVVTQVVGDLVGRVEQARDFSKEWGVAVREWLEFRKGKPDAAAALWPKVVRMPAPTAPIVARVRKSDYLPALIGFKIALPLCQLDRPRRLARPMRKGSEILDQPRQQLGLATWETAMPAGILPRLTAAKRSRR
jgi:hypothetical protein